MKPTQAKEPFRFFTRLSMTVATGVSAADLTGLLDGIRGAPDSVIYTHTHRFLQQLQFLVPEPSNDFAVWAAEALQDQGLAEKLMAVDTVGFTAISELRAAFVKVLEEHLAKRGPGRRAPEGDELHFTRSVRFSLPTRHEAADLPAFAEGLKKVSVRSVYLHMFEAKLRPPLGRNDFSEWFEKGLGLPDLAEQVHRLDPYAQTLEELRKRILGMVERRLEEASHA